MRQLKTPVNSLNEMEETLRLGTTGFLGLSVNGMPYVLPLTYVYENGRILFHCALKGKKLDFIRENPQVCFTVGNQYGKVCRHPCGADCSEDNDSVICYGRARIIEEISERQNALNTFNRRISPGAEEITFEAASKCYAVEIVITNMTGRYQRKGVNRKYYEYTFRA